MVRALASHQCVPGSIPGPGVICGLSLLLVLYSAPRGFSPGTPVFPSHQKPTLLNSNSIWKQWMKSHLVEMPLQNPIIIIIIIKQPEFSFSSNERSFFYRCVDSIFEHTKRTVGPWLCKTTERIFLAQSGSSINIAVRKGPRKTLVRTLTFHLTSCQMS